MAEGGGGGPRDDDDLFDGWQFDDEFVRDATYWEPVAHERIADVRDLHAAGRRGQTLPPSGKRTRRRAGRRRAGGGAIRTAVGGLLVVAIVMSQSQVRQWQDRHPSDGHAGLESDTAAPHIQMIGGMPPPSPEQRATALGRPAPPPAGAGGYKFLQVHAGSPAPVTYDPCRPIHVVIAGRGQPAEVDEMLREGLDAVSSATGLVFVIDGPTDERPVDERAPYQPDRYPGRWAPVLIAWSDPEESPKLASDVAGFAGSIRVSVSSPPASEYVSGEVVFDTPQLVETLGRRGGAKRVRTVIAHELGHLVGLDHVDDPSQIMAPRVNTEVNGYGDGDRRGLAQLGQGPCSPAI